MSRHQRRLVSSALFASVAFVCLLATLWRRPTATAGPPPPLSPTQFASQDMIVPDLGMYLKGLLRYALVCGASPSEKAFTGAAVKLAAEGRLSEIDATAIACLVGAPTGVSCDQIKECSGASGSAVKAPICDGALLRTTRVKDGSPAIVSCASLGQDCYSNENVALCGQRMCPAGETYACDGDKVLACVSGVETSFRCGLGKTCGRTEKSKIIDCIGTHKLGCGQERCEGTTAVSCLHDSFGGGSERAVDCASLGLSCQMVKGSARCVQPGAGSQGDCAPGTAPTCDGNNIKICAGTKAFRFSCEELGLTGKCSGDGGTLACH